MTTSSRQDPRRPLSAEDRQRLREVLERPPDYKSAEEESDDVAIDDEVERGEEYEDEAPRRRTPPAPSRYRSQRARSYDTALIDGTAVDALMVWTVRVGSIVMLVGSTVGSIGAFNGDVTPLLNALPFFWQAKVSQYALLSGILLQAWITGVEYWQAPPTMTLSALIENKVYTLHLVVDIALTVLGYGAIIIPWIQNIIIQAAQIPSPTAAVLAFLFACIAACFVAILPERLLIRR